MICFFLFMGDFIMYSMVPGKNWHVFIKTGCSSFEDFNLLFIKKWKELINFNSISFIIYGFDLSENNLNNFCEVTIDVYIEFNKNYRRHGLKKLFSFEKNSVSVEKASNSKTSLDNFFF